MKKLTLYLVLCLLLSLIGNSVHAQTSLSEFDTKLAELAANMNKKMPVTDHPFRMDSVGTRPGKVMVYNYTILDSDKLNLDYVGTKKSLEANIIESLKNNTKMKSFGDNDVTMLYNYYDEHGKKQMIIQLKASQYK